MQTAAPNPLTRRLFARMPKTLALAATFVFALLFTGILSCVAAHPAYADSETFSLLADTHVRMYTDDSQCYNNRQTANAFKWSKTLPNLKAVIVAGDITDRGYTPSFRRYVGLWNAAKVNAKRIQCIGNHDTNGGGWWDRWIKTTDCVNAFKGIANGGKLTTFTRFKYANVITLGGGQMDSAGSTIYTPKMLKVLNTRLRKTAREGKMAIVVCHYPYRDQINHRDEMMRILSSYPNVLYVSGHKHRYPESQQFETVHEDCGTNPYARNGIDVASTHYPFLSLGINSVTTFHNAGGGYWTSRGRDSYSAFLNVNANGTVMYRRHNLSSGSDKTWITHQPRSSVTVKAEAPEGSPRAKMTYRVVFSDGKTYGGIKSGDTFTLPLGKQKVFSDIPSGVLVTVKNVKLPRGWSKAERVKVEVAKANRTVTMSHAYVPEQLSKQKDATPIHAVGAKAN